jgi:hypothetical protein
VVCEGLRTALAATYHCITYGTSFTGPVDDCENQHDHVSGEDNPRWLLFVQLQRKHHAGSVSCRIQKMSLESRGAPFSAHEQFPKYFLIFSNPIHFIIASVV